MKIQCAFCGTTKRKNSRNWFLFRGMECCLACKLLLQGDHGTAYLQYRREQLFDTKLPSEIDSPQDWLAKQLVTQAS